MIAVEPVVSIQNLHKTFFVEGEGDKASFSFTPIRFLRHFIRLLFFPDAADKWTKSVVALSDINLDVMPDRHAAQFAFVGGWLRCSIWAGNSQRR
jgi:hypothetical protein